MFGQTRPIYAVADRYPAKMSSTLPRPASLGPRAGRRRTRIIDGPGGGGTLGRMGDASRHRFVPRGTFAAPFGAGFRIFERLKSLAPDRCGVALSERSARVCATWHI